jgi:hypothetical protein
MTEDEIKTAILQVCKVSGNDSDFNVLGFYALCDRLVELGVATEREAYQHRIDTLHKMYTLVSQQRDELMAQQRAQVEAIRARGQG